MFKILIFSTFIICTLGAPTEKHEQPGLLLKPDDHKDNINKDNSPPTVLNNERKYGEHVAKRDTISDKSEVKPLNNNQSPKLSSHSETKELPAEQKPKRETHTAQTLPAALNNHDEKKESSSDKSKIEKEPEEKRHKRNVPKPDTLPALQHNDDDKAQPNGQSADSHTEHSKTSEPAILPSSGQPHKRDTAQNLPAKEVQTLANKNNSKISTNSGDAKDNKKSNQKRDIPVSLIPSTSAKPESHESVNKPSSDEKNSKNENQHRPLPAYTKPVPVADLFKQN